MLRRSFVLTLPAALSARPGQAIAAALQPLIAANEIPGAVTCIAGPDGVSHLTAHGFADPAKSQALKDDALFWIASMTKPVTATAIMILAGEGKLSIDDLASKYIPELAALNTPGGAPANVTLKHMLTHTSGMGEASPDDSKNAATLKELIASYPAKPMFFAPGAQWKYCQSGINTLGRIVEIVSGQDLETFFQKRLFEPLGMKDTTFYPKPAQASRIVQPVRLEDGKLTPTTVSILQGKQPSDINRYPAANGGLYATAADYARFARMILNGGQLDGRRFLSQAGVKEMTSIHTGDLKAGFLPGHGWGLAWGVVREPQDMTAKMSPGTYGHGGAYGTQCWIDPVKQLAFILMIQRAGLPNSDGSTIRRAFQDAALS
jgi:CubicO group peptidase (beta-lactamase class C family)